MPYYDEYFLNRIAPSGNASSRQAVVLEDSRVLSYRTAPHMDAQASMEIADKTADPYAYFLDNLSKRNYARLLAERGLPAEGAPDRGHAFQSSKYISTGSPTTFWNKGNALDVWENVRIYPNIPSADRLNHVHPGRENGQFVPNSDGSGLDAYAQSAYSRVAPTTMVFDSAQFLGELREGLPRIASEALKGGLKSFKGYGSDYLNVEFGWKPFISDLQNAGRALFTATQAFADNSKRVHRRHEAIPLMRSDHRSGSSSLLFNSGYSGQWVAGFGPSPSPGGSTGGGVGASASYEFRKTMTQRRWFEGEFTNFLPLGFDPTDFFQKLDLLVKVKWDPSTLWELAPWSWLIDWNLKIGDSIAANLQAANDRLVMHYGYAMETTVYTTECTWRRTSESKSYSGVPQKGRWFTTSLHKRRLRANPYGFKVNSSSQPLTVGQNAILGALGLTKLK